MDLVQVTDAVDLRGCVAVSLLAVVALLWLERRCTSSLQPLRWRHAASVGKALCLAYSTANAAVVAYILPKMIMWGHFTSVHQASCVRLDAPAARTMFAVYLLSKVYECSDMVLVLLQGYPIHIHFRLHHWTTLSLAWSFAQTRSAAGATFLVANAFMHAWVYLYHGGGRWGPVFWVCRVWGHVQLLVGMLCCGYAAWVTVNGGSGGSGAGDTVSACATPGDGAGYVAALHAWGCFLCAVYFCLFQYEIWGPQPSPPPPTQAAALKLAGSGASGEQKVSQTRKDA